MPRRLATGLALELISTSDPLSLEPHALGYRNTVVIHDLLPYLDLGATKPRQEQFPGKSKVNSFRNHDSNSDFNCNDSP